MFNMSSDMELTVFDVDFEPLKLFVVDTTSRIYQGILSMFSLVIGSIFYIGIIYYERYGGDPMKRSHQNRITSAIAFSVVILSNFTNVAMIWRFQFGPLNENMAMFVMVFIHFFVMFMLINLMELLLFKVLI